MQLTRGEQIGRFTVERLLGAGGMATVWAVRDPQIGRLHALKLLSSPHPQLRQRLLREGRAQRRLAHPNILPVHDILSLGGRPALLMPLVEGPSLRALMDRHRVDEATGRALLLEIASGLQAAHDAGLTHRDLKPANVLLDIRDDRIVPRIADFGLVKDADMTMTVHGASFGTPAYAAPEQLRDASSVDPRADLFSLGVLLVELLAGHRPFAGDSIALLVDAHRSAPDLAGLTPPLRELAAQLLSVAPVNRPTLGAVRAALASPAPSALSRSSRFGAVVLELAEEGKAPAPAGAQTWNDESAGIGYLPAQRASFHGRADELERLAGMVSAGQRLITVVGMGGIGKTRLALAFGRSVRDGWAGGVWFGSFAEARTAEAVQAAVAQLMGLPGPGRLVGALQARGPTLLILDCLEQVAAEAGVLLQGWLQEAPELRLVVTSRQPLHVREEQQLRLGVLSEDDAVALFRARAAARAPGFRVDSGNRDEVVALLARLDRLPLAIELAAARVRLLSLDDLSRRLTSRLDVLRSRDRDVPARHRTLRATLEWSWSMLSPEERAVLAQCAVFEGGFTLEAAEEVLSVSGDLWMEDVLADLLDKSLLWREEDRRARQIRLGMLSTVQEFAREQLGSPLREEVEARHTAHYAALKRPRRGGPHEDWAFQAEWENLRAAAARALAAGDAKEAVHAGLAASGILHQRGEMALARETLSKLTALSGLPGELRARVLQKQALFCQQAGELDAAEAACDEALACCGPETRPSLLMIQGNLLRRRGELDDAEARYAAALAAARAHGLQEEESAALGSLGFVANTRGDLDVCIQRLSQALALSRATGNRRYEEACLYNLGSAYHRKGALSEAKRYLEASLAISTALGERARQGVAQGALGTLYTSTAEYARARQAFTAALRLSRELGERYFEAYWLFGLAALHRDEGDPDAAIAAHREAQPVIARHGGQRLLGLSEVTLGLLVKDRAMMDAGEQRLAKIGERFHLAEYLVERVQLERDDGDTSAAAAVLARARAAVAPLDRGSFAALHAALEALGER